MAHVFYGMHIKIKSKNLNQINWNLQDEHNGIKVNNLNLKLLLNFTLASFDHIVNEASKKNPNNYKYKLNLITLKASIWEGLANLDSF